MNHINPKKPEPQRVRWAPSDGMAAGVRIWEDHNEDRGTFVPWSELRDELDRKLLPQLFKDPSAYSLACENFHGKTDWIVKVLDEEGRGYCYLWLGPDPDKNFEFDGLLRVGGNEVPHSWQTYQRFSNGTYRRLASKYKTLEEARAKSGV